MAPDTLSLEGKVAIVTGSGRENGVGAAIAIAFARNGARVAINFVSDATAPRAANVASTIEQLSGRKAVVIQADIATLEGAKKLVDETLKAFGTETVEVNAVHVVCTRLAVPDPPALPRCRSRRRKPLICDTSIPVRPAGRRYTEEKKGEPLTPELPPFRFLLCDS